MLIRFNVSNYLSFDEQQSLMMVSGPSESHPGHMKFFGPMKALRLSAVYGANASGKSNLVKAMASMKALVSGNVPILPDRYFRPKPENRDSPSLFEMEIWLDGALFSYGFEIIISKRTIVDEWLYQLHPDADSTVIFQRTGAEVKHPFDGPEGNRLDVYAEDVAEQRDRLFLNVVGSRARSKDSGLKVFNDIKKWFDDKLVILDTNLPFIPSRFLNDDYFDRLNRFMASFGTGINEIGYEASNGIDTIIPAEILEQMKKDLLDGRANGLGMRSSRNYASFVDYRVSLSEDGSLRFDEIVFRHRGNTVYHSEEESDGTRKLFTLMSNLLIDDDDVTFIMDELDSRLHPKMTYHLVDLFLNKPDFRGKQLIFTTHESYLMDFGLLRRDEIWFTDKNADGASSLYSLEEFNERADRRIEKAYREGRYRGTPVFSSVFPPREDP